MQRNITLLGAVLMYVAAPSQIAMPDSAAVIKNKVKVARIYFESKDGKRYEQKELHYDRRGRLIAEQDDDHSFYYAYEYDNKGRKITTTQRSADGGFIQKFTEEYNDQSSTRNVRLYLEHDTLHPAHLYVYDAAGRKIREEQYFGQGQVNIYAATYNNNGIQIATYDSSGSSRTVSFREHDRLMKRRTYDPEGKLLNEFSFSYHANGNISTIRDSAASGKVLLYQVYYNDAGAIAEYRRNGNTIDEPEISVLRKEFYYVFPRVDAEEARFGLPIPELISEHNFTYDRKGNITRDKLVQTQGSSIEEFTYVYEYEFY